MYLQNILTLHTLEVLWSVMGRGLYSTTVMLVNFYSRPLSDVNQLEVGAYQ
jgi:hypothetical protein